MGRKFGVSFSWKRAIGLSAAKGRLSRAIGIPLTRSGRLRKFGPHGLGLFLAPPPKVAKLKSDSTPTPKRAPPVRHVPVRIGGPQTFGELLVQGIRFLVALALLGAGVVLAAVAAVEWSVDPTKSNSRVLSIVVGTIAVGLIVGGWRVARPRKRGVRVKRRSRRVDAFVFDPDLTASHSSDSPTLCCNSTPFFEIATGGSLSEDAYWCETVLRLPRPVQTPLHSRVTLLEVCVDIRYRVVGVDEVVLDSVTLARKGGSILGSNMQINVAAYKTGEAWYATYLCDERLLKNVVEQDLSVDRSRLLAKLTAGRREEARIANVDALTDALNSHRRPDEIAEIISRAGRNNEIVFTYTKPDGAESTRHVTVEGVSGQSIYALDHSDFAYKQFRIDRISGAERA